MQLITGLLLKLGFETSKWAEGLTRAKESAEELEPGFGLCTAKHSYV